MLLEQRKSTRYLYVLLRQHYQIKEFVRDETNPVWDSETIDLRHQAMIEFALERWGFNRFIV